MLSASHRANIFDRSARRCFSLAEVDETLKCVTEVLAGPWEVRGWDPPAKPRSSTGQKLQETNLEKGDLHDPSSLRQSISLRWQVVDGPRPAPVYRPCVVGRASAVCSWRHFQSVT
jgi:hypothetical protein